MFQRGRAAVPRLCGRMTVLPPPMLSARRKLAFPKMQSLTKLMLFLIAFCLQVLAAPLDGTSSGIATTSIVFGVGAIILGLFLVFAGVRMFKLALFAAGFVVFSNLAGFVLVLVAPDEGFSDLVMILVPIAFGIIGGFISYKLWQFGLSLVGFLGGSFVALLILGVKSGGVIESGLGKILFVVGMGIVGAVLIQILEKPALVFSTSLAGSYLTFYGIDVFARTGFANSSLSSLYQLREGQAIVYDTSGPVIGMMVGVLVLTIIGCFSQYRSIQGKDYREGI